jgi:hypothetical protein
VVREERLPLPLELDLLRAFFPPFVMDAPLAEAQINEIIAEAKDIVDAKKPPAEPGLEKGNGHGPAGGNGAIGGNGAGGNGKKTDAPPIPEVVEPKEQEKAPEPQAKRNYLTKTEKKSWNKIVPTRGAPPYAISVVSVMQAAMTLVECITLEGLGPRNQAIENYRQYIADLKVIRDKLEENMLVFGGTASKKLRGKHDTITKHIRFIDRLISYLEEFRGMTDPILWIGHRKRVELENEKKEALKQADKPPIVEALGKYADKVIKTIVAVGGAICIETAANFWAQYIPLPPEVHFALLAAAIGGTLYLGATWLLGQIKKDMKARINKEYEEKLRQSCCECRLAMRPPLEALTLELMREFRVTYPDNANAQMKKLTDFIFKKTGTDLTNGSIKGKPQFREDKVIAEMLAKSLCKPPF